MESIGFLFALIVIKDKGLFLIFLTSIIIRQIKSAKLTF